MENVLLAFDFDGTMFKTFEPSPNGIGVYESSLLAVQSIFGDRGVHIYSDQGELNNRAPTEIIHDLIAEDAELVDYAKRYWEQHAEELAEFVPEGKGRSLDRWNNHTIAELLVRKKLSYSLAEIGTQYDNGDIWPQPCEGFLEFWSYLEDKRYEGDISISTAIISSGHDEFINRTFKTWGLSLPDILVTEDNIRKLELPDRIDLRVKPGPTPMMFAYEEWLGQCGFIPPEGYVYAPILDGHRIIYFGDDLLKDGQLAVQNGIEFGHFNADTKLHYQESETGFVFSDWQDIRPRLERM